MSDAPSVDDRADDRAADAPRPTTRRCLRVSAKAVVTLAAAALGELDADQVPAALRAVARFAPARRARAGGTAIGSGSGA